MDPKDVLAIVLMAGMAIVTVLQLLLAFWMLDGMPCSYLRYVKDFITFKTGGYDED